MLESPVTVLQHMVGVQKHDLYIPLVELGSIAQFLDGAYPFLPWRSIDKQWA